MPVKKVENFNVHETPETNQNEFDVETYLNANWEKTKEVVNNNADELTEVQKDNEINKSNIENITKGIEIINEKDKTQDKSIEGISTAMSSINEKIEDINSKGDEQEVAISTNKELIEELQYENIEVKAENKRLREDIKSIATIGEINGENVHIEDSSEARCEIEIYGKNVQENREGYNLLDLSNFSTQTKNGVTATKNEDGSIKLVGTNSGDTFNINFGTTNGEIGDYVASGVTGGSREKYFLAIVQPGIKTFTEVTSGSSKFSLTEETTIAANIYIVKGATINTTIYPMLIKGTENKLFEQYGSSPSIQYPSHLKSVRDNIKVNIINKNHLSTIPQTTFSLQGIQTTFDGEKFICKGTAMYNYFNLVTQRIRQHFKAGTYTFSSNMFAKGRACIRFYYEDGTADTYYSNINTRKISFTLKKDTYEYFLMVDGLTVGGGDVIDCIIKLQLEDGNTSTEIVKAENQEFVVDVQQEMLDGDKFVKQEGKWYEKHCWRTIIFDGKNMASQAGGTFESFKENGNIVRTFEIKDLLISSVRNDIFCDKLPRQANSMWNGVSYGIQTWQGQNKILISLPFDDVEKKYGQELTIDNYVTAFYKYLQDEVLTIYYYLTEPTLLECTEKQNRVLDEIYNKAHTYKNITNILIEASEVNPIINVEYFKDTETEHNKLQAQIDEIKQLLSSTETSALLLDNIQKDLESEV